MTDVLVQRARGSCEVRIAGRRHFDDLTDSTSHDVSRAFPSGVARDREALHHGCPPLYISSLLAVRVLADHYIIVSMVHRKGSCQLC